MINVRETILKGGGEGKVLIYSAAHGQRFLSPLPLAQSEAILLCSGSVCGALAWLRALKSF